MKIRILIFVLLSSLVLLAGCDLFNNEQEKSIDELMPLAVGNYWEYEYNRRSFKDTLRYEVATEIQVPWGDTSYTAYGYNRVPLPPEIPEFYWLYRNGEAGLYLMGGMADTDTLYTQYVNKPWPAGEGQIWDIPRLAFSRDSLKFYVSDTLQVTLIDTDREIETPAGTFECYVYKYTVSLADDVRLNSDYFMYYSPGVGLVAQISTTENEPEDIDNEMYLMNYRVK